MTKQQEISIEALQKKAKVNFKNIELLKTALTHSSFAKQHKTKPLNDNERLEFFGDAILKFVVSEYIYTQYPSQTEGELTKLRAHMVSDKTLAEVATNLCLGDYIQVSYSESKSQGQYRSSILSDALEAIIGAYYLDSGLQKVSKFITQHIIKYKLKDLEKNPISDYKSQLQEYLQKTIHALPKYSIVEEKGPDHCKLFTVSVTFTINNKEQTFLGSGLNKKEAEQDAAKDAFKSINKPIKKANSN